MIDNGTAAKFFREQKVEVGYYRASIVNLNGFRYGKEVCRQCNTEQKLFTINPNLHPDPVWICINCLTSIKIKNKHDTELGLVDLDLSVSLKKFDARSRVKDAYYLEMSRTPYYLTIQGERWKGHCDDFMDYIGTWEAPDFTKASGDGNGRALFLSMTEESAHQLWDRFDLAEDETEYTWQDCLYHAFECRHCAIKLGYWEH